MKRWSTKDLYTLRPPADGRPGDAILTFTDRYSVYSFGVMPDEIPGKGKASCAMAVSSFGLLSEAGVRTHFVEQVSDNAIRVQLLDVDVDVDGRSSRTGPGSLIPLQVVYRNALPRESSVHRRVAAGGLDAALVPPRREPGSPWLTEAMVEFTTKFEVTDRFVTREEAARVGGVSAEDLDRVEREVRVVNEALSSRSAEAGMELVDGKVEYGFDGDGEPLLVDHAGTPDENRFYFAGVPVCKELLRFLHPDLRELVELSVSKGLPRDQWPAPPRLDPALVASTAEVYTALAEVWTTRSVAARERLTAAVEHFADESGAAGHLGERIGL